MAVRSPLLIVAVITAIVAAFFGSVALRYIEPIGDDIVLPLEQRCIDVANRGYAIHSAYPDMTLEEMPVDDVRRMLELDEIWMRECVGGLPPNVIIDIANNVERNQPARGE